MTERNRYDIKHKKKSFNNKSRSLDLDIYKLISLLKFLDFLEINFLLFTNDERFIHLSNFLSLYLCIFLSIYQCILNEVVMFFSAR